MSKVRLNRFLVVLATCIVSVLMMASGSIAAEMSFPHSPDMLAIQGNWIRTDAPYRIEIRHAEGGSLQATYFNPKPINVGKTETAEQDGFVHLLIELQDVNYPGSTYVLTYDRSQDVLEGIYYHRASGQSFEVRFVRQAAKQ